MCAHGKYSFGIRLDFCQEVKSGTLHWNASAHKKKKKENSEKRRGGTQLSITKRCIYGSVFIHVASFKTQRQDNPGSFPGEKCHRLWTQESFGAQQQQLDICTELSEMYVDLFILVQFSLSFENIMKSTQIDWLKALKSVESCVCKIQVMEIN